MDVMSRMKEMIVIIQEAKDFMRFGDYQELDKLFAGFVPSEMSTEAMLAWARATYPCASRLPERGKFLYNAYREVESRNEDAQTIFQGLDIML